MKAERYIVRVSTLHQMSKSVLVISYIAIYIGLNEYNKIIYYLITNIKFHKINIKHE